MSVTGTVRCDECGRDITQAHRIYHGVRHCTTCYARIFKRSPCPKCGELARLPKDQSDAVCRRCELAKPCARCGKAGYKIGLVTPYGPVCGACAPHFREPKPCDACGRMSCRLTRVKRLGTNRRLCPQCARSDYKTCPACHRYRALVDSRDGRRLCRNCAERDDIPCPSCGESMPAGRGAQCEACYWTKTCRKRVDMDLAAFSVVETRDAFGEFGRWLESKVGAHKAALTVHRYLPFFVAIEARWKQIPEYAELLGRFGAEGLRLVRLPMRWLRETYGIEPDSGAREADSEQRRIQALAEALPSGSRAAMVLADYQRALMSKFDAGRISLRSVRLALRPAVSLLLAADPCGNNLPDQRVVDRYLLSTPGQRAAATGFIRFLPTDGALRLAARVDRKRAQLARRRALEREIMSLTRRPEEGEAFERRWIAVGIVYFHDTKTSKVAAAVVTHGDEGLWVETDGERYFLPKPKVITLQRSAPDEPLTVNSLSSTTSTLNFAIDSIRRNR